MQCIQAGLANHSKDIVFLQEQLSGGVEADSMVGQAFLNVFRLVHDQRHGLVPGCGLQLSIPTDQGVFRTVRMVHCFPAGDVSQ